MASSGAVAAALRSFSNSRCSSAAAAKAEVEAVCSCSAFGCWSASVVGPPLEVVKGSGSGGAYIDAEVELHRSP
jgi:hypothetical protein